MHPAVSDLESGPQFPTRGLQELPKSPPPHFQRATRLRLPPMQVFLRGNLQTCALSVDTKKTCSLDSTCLDAMTYFAA